MNFFRKSPVPLLDKFPKAPHVVTLGPDVRNYFSTLLDELGGTSITGAERETAIQKLAHQYDRFMSYVMVNALLPEKLEQFMALQKSHAPQSQIEGFLANNLPNLKELFAQSYIDFRLTMLEKVKK